MNSEDAIKQKVQRWIVCGSAAIMLGKFIAFWVTNSVGILTDAMESIVNVIAGFISLYSLYWAAKPKDAEHPFGHGRMEYIAAFVVACLVRSTELSDGGIQYPHGETVQLYRTDRRRQTSSIGHLFNHRFGGRIVTSLLHTDWVDRQRIGFDLRFNHHRHWYFHFASDDR